MARRMVVLLSLTACAVAVSLAVVSLAVVRAMPVPSLGTTLQTGSDWGRLALALDRRTQRIFVAGQTTVTVLDARRGTALRDVDTLPLRPSPMVCRGAICGFVASYSLPVQPVSEEVAVDEAIDRVFVTNSDRAQLTVLDARTGALLQTVGVGHTPHALLIDKSHHHVFVANVADGTVSVLDGRSGHIERTVAVGRSPLALALDPRAHRLLVANAGDGSLSVVDTARGQVMGTVAAGRRPVALAVDTSTHRAYIADQERASVSIVDIPTLRVLRVLSVGASPVAVTLDERLARAFVLNSTGHSVSIIDTQTLRVLHTVALPGVPRAEAIDGSTGRLVIVLMATDTGGTLTPTGSLSVLDARTGRLNWTLPTGHISTALAIDERERRFVVLNQGCLGGAQPFDSVVTTVCRGVRPAVYPGVVERILAFAGHSPQYGDTTVRLIDAQKPPN